MATIPSLALIPSGYKASKVYSVLPTDGTGDFDFTRSGNATRVNSDGLIELVTTNVPRLNYPLIDGVVNGCPSLLLEPLRTNLIQYSEDFSQGYWTKSGSSVVSGFTSPDGTTNAFKLVEDTANSTHTILNNSITTSGSASSSIYAKYLSRYLRLTIHDTTNPFEWYSVIYDLQNGNIYDSLARTVTVFDSKIEQMTDGYYKCVITADLGVSSGTRLYVQLSDGTPISLGDDRGRGVYQGDGTSGIYIWGAQLEEGSYPTSYIPNYGTALGATRSAETCNNAGDANTFNDSEGVLFAEISAFDDSTKQFSISDGTSASSVKFLYLSGNVFSFQVRDNFVTQCTINNTLTNVNETIKAAAKYKQNDFVLWVNGFKVGQDTIGTVPIGLSELAYDDGGGGAPFYSSTKQIQYFDTTLTDTDLEELTSWTSFNEMAQSQLYKTY